MARRSHGSASGTWRLLRDFLSRGLLRKCRLAIILLRFELFLEDRSQQPPEFTVARGLTALRQILRDIHYVCSIVRRPANTRIHVGPFMFDVQALGVGVEDQVPKIRFRD